MTQFTRREFAGLAATAVAAPFAFAPARVHGAAALTAQQLLDANPPCRWHSKNPGPTPKWPLNSDPL